MANQIITIGRTHGSGGRYVGEILSKLLGIPCYDSQLVVKTAAQSGLAPSFVAANEEQAPSFLYSLVMGLAPSSPESQPMSMQMFQTQSEVIRAMAERESCIIVGRCADYILRNVPNVTNVFIHAPLEARVKRVSTRERVSPQAAEKDILRQDKERAAYYKFFANQRWGDANNYHLTLDTSRLGIEGAAKMIQLYLENASKDSI